MKNNENPIMCAECGGLCCIKHPCFLFPQDIFKDNSPSYIKFKQFILTYKNIVVFDYLDEVSERKRYFLRVRTVDEARYDLNRLVIPTWGGRCCCLTDKGCKFDFENRPTGGKLVEPNYPNCSIPKDKLKGCKNGKYLAAKEWSKYFKYINKFFKEKGI